MTHEISISDYVAFLEKEYFSSFVAEGGCAVKVAVVPDNLIADTLTRELLSCARGVGYVGVAVDSAETRINMIQQIFYAVARELDWRGYAARVVESLVLEEFGEGARGASTLDGLVKAMASDRIFVNDRMDRRLLKAVFRNYRLAKDFRLAMVHLCLGEFRPELYTETACESLVEWLRGELRLISALKERQIFQKIARHNARSMLASTARWVTQAGDSGFLLVIDGRRLVVTRRDSVGDSSTYYTPAAFMDALEVLRQFIDATDDMEHLMLVFIAPFELLDEAGKRRFADYPALRNRIWDDVRDRERANPCAPMVRIAPDGGGAAWTA